MHRMFFLASILCAIALPAYAVEPKPQITIEVRGTATEAAPAATVKQVIPFPDHTVVVMTDGTVEHIPVVPLPAQPVQPYGQEQVGNGGHALFGGTTVFSTQVSDCVAAATTQARKAKLEVVGDIIARCREIAVDQTDADTRHDVAMKALELDRQMSAQADGAIAVGERPATVLAANGAFGGSGSFANWGDQVGQIGWSMNAIDTGLSSGFSGNNTPVDTDRDGIGDSADQCPAAAETVNQFKDDDGCPDTASAQPKQPPAKTAEDDLGIE